MLRFAKNFSRTFPTSRKLHVLQPFEAIPTKPSPSENTAIWAKINAGGKLGLKPSDLQSIFPTANREV